MIKVGVLPKNTNDQYSYSSSCRAWSLIRNIEYCSLFKEGEEYDIIYLQKCFDVFKINALKKRYHCVVVDTCDSYIVGDEEIIKQYENSVKSANYVTVPTETLAKKIRHELNLNNVYVGPDVMEFNHVDIKNDLFDRKTVVVYGTYHNVLEVKKYISTLNKIFDDIIIISDNDHHLSKLQLAFQNEKKCIFIGWNWDSLFDILRRSHIGLIVYKSKEDGYYKSCNRALIGLHAGITIVSGENPQVETLSEMCKGIYVHYENDFKKVMKKALTDSLQRSTIERKQIQEDSHHTMYSEVNAVFEWDLIFRNIYKRCPQ